MIKLFSPAKINLFFKLAQKREDGYHNLCSLFQAISLGDDLEIALSKKDQYETNVKSLGFNDENFIVKALFLFRTKTKIDLPVRIRLHKRVPMQGGLGGGSSNASTMLWGLNELFKKPLSTQDLQVLSASITSDSPFFFSQGTAICEGRGEKVINLEPLLNSNVWLVKPEIGMQTRAVYKRAKSSIDSFDYSDLLERFYQNNSPVYPNDLEAAAYSLSPELRDLKQELFDQGYEFVFMTGSGSTFVCIGKNKPISKKTVQIFPVQYISRPLNQWYSS
ncbi:MAG: 4-diphosphocytidyl-2-C-methyl-D-erythritol kinase [Chlamydiae bacterium]|nr:4-diphosphocytidyl-2-C-methyl-D-erythritol kinase [Chlamydiota bacterium]